MKLKFYYKWVFSFTILLLSYSNSKADDGYRLWLKYDKIDDIEYLNRAEGKVSSFVILGHSNIMAAAQDELKMGLSGLFGHPVPGYNKLGTEKNCLVVGTGADELFSKDSGIVNDLKKLKKGGYLIRDINYHSNKCLAIIANEDVGALYGVFHFLRLLQIRQPLEMLNIISSPEIELRMLNHWDNLDGSVERGYAGKSLWQWAELPAKVDKRYKDYARACASVGINGVVLNNVNAQSEILSKKYLEKVAALAAVFKPYGIQVFLSANFASPKTLGGLATADPLDSNVANWWKSKAAEIYKIIPQFGGWLVKASSEGQPGPGDYHRTHAEGANMMARALKPYGGILIWRAFVYDIKKGEDRAKMAYREFKGLDGKFDENILLQIKNGPLDFQPREPFSPLFGAMPRTNEMLEFQITNEYLGHNKALVFLAPLFKETLLSDTYAFGPSSTVAKIVNGSMTNQSRTGIAGVANTGDSPEWTGFIFGQANWFAFGRLSWNSALSCEQIAGEWIKMTLTHHEKAINTIRNIMLDSREVLVNYQMPMGLNVLSGFDHYCPKPSVRQYYHKADSSGLGFDRTSSGSNTVSQYFPAIRDSFNILEHCPEKYLCWFHHVPWSYKMPVRKGDGVQLTFWETLCAKYNSGVNGVRKMNREWLSVKGFVDPQIFEQTEKLLINQGKEAVHWRNVCLNYFKSFSGLEMPN